MGAVDALMLTDAPLLYSPAQLALAALRSGCSSRGIKVTRFIERAAEQALSMAASVQGSLGADGSGDGHGRGGAAAGSGASQQRLAVPNTREEAVAKLVAVLDALDQLGREGATKVEQQVRRGVGNWGKCMVRNRDHACVCL